MSFTEPANGICPARVFQHLFCSLVSHPIVHVGLCAIYLSRLSRRTLDQRFLLQHSTWHIFLPLSFLPYIRILILRCKILKTINKTVSLTLLEILNSAIRNTAKQFGLWYKSAITISYTSVSFQTLTMELRTDARGIQRFVLWVKVFM